MSIFVVDDHRDFLEGFELWADPAWEVHYFTSADEAAEQIHLLSPKIIISDAKMPGIHGIEFLNYTRLVAPEIKLICVSAYTVEQLKANYGHVEGATFLKKPLGAQDFTFIKKLVESTPEVDLSDAIQPDLLNESLTRLKQICTGYFEYLQTSPDEKDFKRARLGAEMDLAFKVLGLDSLESRNLLLKRWSLVK